MGLLSSIRYRARRPRQAADPLGRLDLDEDDELLIVSAHPTFFPPRKRKNHHNRLARYSTGSRVCSTARFLRYGTVTS